MLLMLAACHAMKMPLLLLSLLLCYAIADATDISPSVDAAACHCYFIFTFSPRFHMLPPTWFCRWLFYCCRYAITPRVAWYYTCHAAIIDAPCHAVVGANMPIIHAAECAADVASCLMLAMPICPAVIMIRYYLPPNAYLSPRVVADKRAAGALPDIAAYYVANAVMLLFRYFFRRLLLADIDYRLFLLLYTRYSAPFIILRYATIICSFASRHIRCAARCAQCRHMRVFERRRPVLLLPRRRACYLWRRPRLFRAGKEARLLLHVSRLLIPCFEYCCYAYVYADMLMLIYYAICLLALFAPRLFHAPRYAMPAICLCCATMLLADACRRAACRIMLIITLCFALLPYLPRYFDCLPLPVLFAYYFAATFVDAFFDDARYFADAPFAIRCSLPRRDKRRLRICFTCASFHAHMPDMLPRSCPPRAFFTIFHHYVAAALYADDAMSPDVAAMPRRRYDAAYVRFAMRTADAAEDENGAIFLYRRFMSRAMLCFMRQLLSCHWYYFRELP